MGKCLLQCFFRLLNYPPRILSRQLLQKEGGKGCSCTLDHWDKRGRPTSLRPWKYVETSSLPYSRDSKKSWKLWLSLHRRPRQKNNSRGGSAENQFFRGSSVSLLHNSLETIFCASNINLTHLAFARAWSKKKEERRNCIHLFCSITVSLIPVEFSHD